MPDNGRSFEELALEGRGEEALAVARRAALNAREAEDPSAEVEALNKEAEALRMLERNEESLQRAEQAAALAREIGYGPGEADALRAQGNALGKLNRNEESLQRAEQATALARKIGDRLAEINALDTQADALLKLERSEESLERAEQAAALAQQVGNRLAEVHALLSQAEALRLLQRNDESLQRAERAAALAQEIGYRLAQANALTSQAAALEKLDRNEESLQRAEQAAALAHEIGYRRGEAGALHMQAKALRMLERNEESLQRAEQAAALAHEIGDRLGEANALQAQAQALGMLERNEESLQRAEQAAGLAHEIRYRLGEANALRSQADALRQLDRNDESLQRAEQAAGLAHDIGDRLGEANALHAQAVTLHMLDRNEEAFQRAEPAAALAREIGDRRAEANALFVKAFAAAAQGNTQSALSASRHVHQLCTEIELGSSAAFAGRLEQWLMRAAADEAGARATDRLMEEFGPALVDIRQRADNAEEAWHRELTAPRQPPCPEGQGELSILCQWPSYGALSLFARSKEESGVAGGYVLRWGAQNLVIDPGIGFLHAFKQQGFHLSDIGGVVVTHYHIDHTGDMEELLTSLFEAAEERDNQTEGVHMPAIDFFLSPSTFGIFADLLAHNPGVKSVRLLRPDERVEWGRMEILPVPVYHRDLTGRADDAIGLRIRLQTDDEDRFVVGLTSDSRWDELLIDYFGDVDILIAHLGTIYEEDLEENAYASDHLGIKGAAELISRVAARGTAPRLVVLSELGKELRSHRVKIAEILEAVSGCRPICAGQLGMTVRLPEARPLCDGSRCDQTATRWGYEPGRRDLICFRCDDCAEPDDARRFE